MVNQDKFNFFVPASFEKGKKKGKNVVRVKGVASTVSAEDSDGEILFPNGFDYQPLLNKGFLNWDHQQKGRPSAIVGEPDVAKVINDGKDFYIEGFLYPDSVEAQQVAELAEVLEKNSSTRRLGYSIEGQVIERGCGPEFLDKEKTMRNAGYSPELWKQVKKARITGVAITPCPKNPNTLLSLIKGEYSEAFIEDDAELETDLEKAWGELTIIKGGKGSGRHAISDAEWKGIRNTVKKHIPDSHKVEGYDENDKALRIVAAIKQVGKRGGGSTGSFIGDSWNEDLSTNEKLHKELKEQGYNVKGDKTHIIVSKEIKKAMSAEGASAVGLLPEHVEGTKNHSKVPLDEDKEHSVGSLVKKSEVYNLIARNYTTDLVKAKQIFNFIQSVNQKFFNMENNQITQEAIDKAFDFLNKASETDIIKGGDNDADDVEKAKKACSTMMKGEGKSKEEAEEALVKSGFSLEVSKSAVESVVSEMSNLKENGGEVTSASPATVTGADQPLSKAEETAVLQTAQTAEKKPEVIEKSVVDELFKEQFGMTNELIKGLGDNMGDKFKAVGTLFKSSFAQNELLKSQVEDLSGRLKAMEDQEQPIKSARNVKALERFQKSGSANAQSYPVGTNIYYMDSKEDREALLDVMDAEIQKSRLAGQKPSDLLEKAVSELEIVKSLPKEVFPLLRSLNIAVEAKTPVE